MGEETRRTILDVLTRKYPERVSPWDLEKATGLSTQDLERHLRYLEEKGQVDITWMSAGFDARVDVLGIQEIGAEIVDRDTTRKILEPLEKEYPKDVESDEFLGILGLDEDELRRPFKYLEDVGFVKVTWFLGKKFLVRITAEGIDELENV